MYLLILIPLIYLPFQKYIHLGLPLKLLADINPSNIFYLSLLIFFSISYFLFSYKKIENKNKIKSKIKIIGIVNLLLICLIELIRIKFVNTLSGYYFDGYPVDKIIVAGFYSIILFLVLLQILSLWFSLTKSKLVFLRSIFIELIFIIVIVVGSFFYNSNFQENSSIYSGEKEFDYVVIMGAAVFHNNKPSPILKQRILKAINIYRRGLANKIICTGGNAPGEIAEAKVEKSILLQHGIPIDKIITEVNTSTTLEQIVYLRNILYPNKSAIIVSDKFHLNRIKLMANTMKLDVVPIASGLKLKEKSFFYFNLRDSVATLLFMFFGI